MLTVENLIIMMEECREELMKLGYPMKDKRYHININKRLKSKLGYIQMISSRTYKIDINYHFLLSCHEADIKNTMMHELIHSIDGCMNHGRNWKYVAGRVNSEYGYHISRTSSIPEYNKVYKQMSHKQQYKYSVMCSECHQTWRYKKKTNLVSKLEASAPHTYHCPYCKSYDFELKYI